MRCGRECTARGGQRATFRKSGEVEEVKEVKEVGEERPIVDVPVNQTSIL
jgi:hypothetical protein